MPFVRISLSQQFQANTKNNISIAVHQSLMEVFNIPEHDYFHVIESLQADQILALYN